MRRKLPDFGSGHDDMDGSRVLSLCTLAVLRRVQNGRVSSVCAMR